MSSKLDEEELEEYREAFVLYDKNKDGRVNAKQLQEIFRYLGTIYQDHEILELIREQGGSDSVDQNQFLNMLGKKMSADASVEDVIKAFQVFDKDGGGMVSHAELRYVLTALGDKLDDELVDSILKSADPTGTGSIQYDNFVRQMYQRT